MASSSLRERLAAPAAPVRLREIDPRATTGAPGGKSRTKRARADVERRLARLQEKLYAAGHVESGPRSAQRLLLVLQGMDTSGKDGTVKHVISAFDPQGCQIAAFKAPTPEELSHDFLWRIRRRVPGPGIVGIFNRSHYEDVLIARVHDLVPEATWSRRYDAINRWEEKLVEDGVTLVKVFLHISRDEQRDRLLARLDRPDKRWKFNPADVDERGYWDAYQQAYETVLERCSPRHAPWYVVPADRKWYRNWAVATLLVGALEDMEPAYPVPDLDIADLRARLGG